MTEKEKAEKYDELQGWFWWLERRTHEGKTPRHVLRVFLIGIKEHFKPYKD